MLITDEDIRAAEREQWDDGNNYLAVAPGVILGYDRNVATNTMLRKHGIEVIDGARQRTRPRPRRPPLHDLPDRARPGLDAQPAKESDGPARAQPAEGNRPQRQGVPLPRRPGRSAAGGQAPRGDRAAAGGPQHRADLREDLHPDPVRVRGRRPRRGRARHLPRPGRIPAGPQGVGEGHRPRARPHVRRHRVPRVRPGIRRRPRRVRRGAGLERAHRHLAPDPDAGRHPDHERPLRQAAGRGVLLLPGRRPQQHGELAAGDRGHARHGRPHLRPGRAAAVGGGARHRRGPGRRIGRQAHGDR